MMNLANDKSENFHHHLFRLDKLSSQRGRNQDNYSRIFLQGQQLESKCLRYLLITISCLDRFAQFTIIIRCH